MWNSSDMNWYAHGMPLLKAGLNSLHHSAGHHPLPWACFMCPHTVFLPLAPAYWCRFSFFLRQSVSIPPCACQCWAVQQVPSACGAPVCPASSWTAHSFLIRLQLFHQNFPEMGPGHQPQVGFFKPQATVSKAHYWPAITNRFLCHSGNVRERPILKTCLKQT